MKKIIICLSSIFLASCNSGTSSGSDEQGTGNAPIGYSSFITMPISSTICNSGTFYPPKKSNPNLNYGNSDYCMPFVKLGTANGIPDASQVDALVKYYYGNDATLTSTCPKITYMSAVPFPSNSEYANNTMDVVNKSLACVDANLNVTNPTFVFDIDDTLLSDYLSHCQDAFGKFDPEAADLRDKMYALPVVPHMDKLLSYAFNHNIKVAFISARPTSETDLTKEDLIKNFPEFSSQINSIFDNGDAFFVSASEKTYSVDVFKNIMREKLKTKGYNVILNIGDQYSDLNYTYPNYNPVKCSFKLPNFIYYIK